MKDERRNKTVGTVFLVCLAAVLLFGFHACQHSAVEDGHYQVILPGSYASVTVVSYCMDTEESAKSLLEWYSRNDEDEMERIAKAHTLKRLLKGESVKVLEADWDFTKVRASDDTECWLGPNLLESSSPSHSTDSQPPRTTEPPEQSASTQEMVPDAIAREVYSMQVEQTLRNAGENVRVEAVGGSHDTLQIKAGIELDGQRAKSLLNGIFSNESLMTNLKSYGFKSVEVDSAPSKEAWRGYDTWTRPLVAIAQPVPTPSAVSIKNLTLLAEPVSSLTDVDFENRSYALNNSELQIKGGVYHYQQDGGFEDVKVREIWSLKDPGSGSQYAIVSLYDVSGGGSSNDEGLVQVYTVANKRLELVQELSFDEQASGSGVKFDSNYHRLTIRARSDDDSPHCCPKNLDVVDFVWSGRGFTLASVVRIPVESRSLR